MLWALLNTLTAPSSRSFFYDNRNDPGFLAWRAQADQVAQQDPEVRAKLAQLDRDLAQKTAQPGTIPASGGGSSVWLVLFLMVAAFVLLWVWRRRRGQTGSAALGLSGSAETRFRVGMTMPLDPAPFLLAANTTKVKPPSESGMISVEAVGLLSDGPVRLHRLYLPGDAGFLQLHLAAEGRPDECRYFSRLDEVEPASNEEWGVWLDPAQGLIGWPEFQTKDGKIYGRVWAPGPTRVPPRALDETRQDLRGTATRRMQAMLYGAPTGATPPAPQTEYVLVAAVEEGGQAWVELDAGIDVNPASLTLPSVAL
jgi:MYXO-CTERM domain-containing protein